MFTNINRRFLIFIRNIIYNNYKGKYVNLRKNLASYKLNKLMKESYDMKGITKNFDTIKKIRNEEQQKKNDNNNVTNFSVLNRIDEIKNLNINQLKSFT